MNEKQKDRGGRQAKPLTKKDRNKPTQRANKVKKQTADKNNKTGKGQQARSKHKL